jgi:hypothetical protein
MSLVKSEARFPRSTRGAHYRIVVGIQWMGIYFLRRLILDDYARMQKSLLEIPMVLCYRKAFSLCNPFSFWRGGRARTGHL